MKLSELAKRQGVLAYASRATVITRHYHGRVVARKIREGQVIVGEHYLTTDNHVCVYVTDGTMPMDYWYLPADDFQWQAYVGVENNT